LKKSNFKHWKTYTWKDYSKKSPSYNYKTNAGHSSIPKIPHSDIRNAVTDIARIEKDNQRNFTQINRDIQAVSKDLERIHSDMHKERK
jgi:hypothetical protein